MNDLRRRILRCLLYRPMSYFDSKETCPAFCVASMAQHAPYAMAALDYRLMINLSNLSASIIGVGIAVVFCWQLGVLGAVLSSSLLALTMLNIRISHKAHENKDREDRSSELAAEIIEQARSIQLAVVEKYFVESYVEQLRAASRFDHRIGLVDSVNFAVTQSFVFFCDMTCYILGTYLIYQGVQTTETVFFAFLGAQFSGWSIMYSAPYFPEIVKASGSARALFKLLCKEPAAFYEDGAKPTITGAITMDKVEFSYPSRPSLRIANGLSFTARQGEAIAVVGTSGCGKSTIINLLQRFYDIQYGALKLDGNRIGNINVRHLRDNIALVGQEPVLFEGTILENILLGTDIYSKDDAIEACRIANASKFIETLPEGYETDVGEKGRALSGGQKQRIAIARALVRRPRILLLDEATSALDAQSEKMVQDALSKAKVGRTVIIVAHRLSSIQNCDRILYIDNGVVVECGTHTELVQMNGKYARLVQAQDLTC